MSIKTVTTDDLRRMNGKEGLVLQGCGGDPQEWLDGINGLLTDEGILKNGSKFENTEEPYMGFNYAAEKKKFETLWARLRREYTIMPFSAIRTQQENAIKNGYRQDCPKKVISAGQNRNLFVFAANLRFLRLLEN